MQLRTQLAWLATHDVFASMNTWMHDGGMISAKGILKQREDIAIIMHLIIVERCHNHRCCLKGALAVAPTFNKVVLCSQQLPDRAGAANLQEFLAKHGVSKDVAHLLVPLREVALGIPDECQSVSYQGRAISMRWHWGGCGISHFGSLPGSRGVLQS